MSKRRTTEEMARELERESEDPALWQQQPVRIEARPSTTSVLSLRLPAAKLHALLRAARDAGESVSEYVRGATAARRKVDHSPATVNVSYSYAGMPSRVELVQWATWHSGGEGASLMRVE